MKQVTIWILTIFLMLALYLLGTWIGDGTSQDAFNLVFIWVAVRVLYQTVKEFFA